MTGVGPSSNDKCSYKRRRESQREEETMYRWNRGWSYVATDQEMPGAPESRGRDGSRPRAIREAQPGPTR